MADYWLNHNLGGNGGGGSPEGTAVKSTGESAGEVLMTNGEGGAVWTPDMTDTEIDLLFLEKGQIIKMTLDGTERQYRILKNVSGSVFEVLGMFDSSSTMIYNDGETDTFSDGTTGRKYAEQTLDTYLNTTWYNTLSATAKEAIVDKNIIQDMWYNANTGDPDYIGKYISGTQYTMSLKGGATLTVGQRHIYALSVQEVLDYLEVTPSMTASTTTLLGSLLNMLFWNSSSAMSVSDAIWLRSASASNSQYSYFISGYTGQFNYDKNQQHYARPAFQIDLSKISYTEV